jgi:hypothetical protein
MSWSKSVSEEVMDIELARDMIRTAFRSGSELQDLLEVIKKRCSPDEYNDYSRGIVAALDAIGVALINKALAAYPHLSAEVDSSLISHGHYR